MVKIEENDKKKVKKEVTKETKIADLLKIDPESAEALFEMDMHCAGCALADHDNLENAARIHGLDADQLVGIINSKLDEKNKI